MKPKKLSLEWRQKLELAGSNSGPGEGALPPSGASAEQLAAINRMPQVLRPLAESDVYVRGVYAINDQQMWNGYRIETPGVLKIAALAVGRPVLANHDTYGGFDSLPAGRVFAGDGLRRADGSTWAVLSAWFPQTEFTTELVQRIDGGAIGEVSVQILVDLLECSICKTDLWECAHVPLQSYDGKQCEAIVRGVTDFLELSMVWAGMAKGTSWFMAAARGREAMAADRFIAERKPRTAALADLFAKAAAPPSTIEALTWKR